MTDRYISSSLHLVEQLRHIINIWSLTNINGISNTRKMYDLTVLFISYIKSTWIFIPLQYSSPVIAFLMFL